MPNHELKLALVADNATTRFGGEAARPFHFFRVLRERKIDVHLIVHSRCSGELLQEFPNDKDRIHFIPDYRVHKLCSRMSSFLPDRIAYFTFGLLSQLHCQMKQKEILKSLIQREQINLIHQPTPISPKFPSLIHGLGVPVILGPLNGDMNYPPTFRYMQSKLESLFIASARVFSEAINRFVPGKLKADTILVWNDRTKEALPSGYRGKIDYLIEGAVNLSVWKEKPANTQRRGKCVKFIYLGRLVDCKMVDLLLKAFQKVLQSIPTKLVIAGDGNQHDCLVDLASELGLSDRIQFTGWLTQSECARELAKSDVLVLPSLREAGGNVLLQAMAVGLPVIAADWGGPMDYVDPSHGILVPVESPDSYIEGLAKAMIQLADSLELRLQMGKAGRKKVEEHFTWEARIDRLLEIYQQSKKTIASDV